LIVVVLTVVVSTGIARSQPQPPPQSAIPNLSGKWHTSEGNEVRVEHRGQTVTAAFLSGGECPGGARTLYFEGQLQGNALTGATFNFCSDKSIVEECGHPSFRPTQFNATIGDNTITGTYRELWYEGFLEAGRLKCETFKRNPSADRDVPFTLTRECLPDRAKRCHALERAIRVIERMIPPAVNVTPDDLGGLPMPTVSFDPTQWNQTLAQNQTVLTAALDALSAEYCDDEDAKRAVEAQKEVLGGLTPGTAQTRSAVIAEMRQLARVDLELRVLATQGCAESDPAAPPPVLPGVCSGVPTKTTSDDQEIDRAIDELKKGIDEATKMAEQFERDEQGGASTTAGQYADYYRTRAGQLSKLKGYWQTIRSATCVPREVVNLLREVRGGRSDMCTRLCERTGDWVSRMYPGPMGETQRQTFLKVCGGNCQD
jgi:hypothetical protein